MEITDLKECSDIKETFQINDVRFDGVSECRSYTNASGTANSEFKFQNKGILSFKLRNKATLSFKLKNNEGFLSFKLKNNRRILNFKLENT